jgi:hypothetical protein
MRHISQIRRSSPDDETVEAIVRGRPVDARFDTWAAFARQVRTAAVDLPGPEPSDELAAVLRGDVELTPEREPLDVGRIASVAAKVATLGAAKVVLGATLAAAGVTGAGAAGVLPGPADDAVRSAIETVTPVHFDDRGRDGEREREDGGEGEGDQGSADPGSGDRPDGFGDDVSDDATGRSDGENGVDGRTTSEEAPGSEHRPDQAGSPDDGSGRPDSTGLDRADETPAAPHAPGTPDPAAGGGGGGDGGPPGPVPSTVPSPPGRSGSHGHP